MMRTRYMAVIVVLVTLAVAAVVVYAGSLNPPAAPTDSAAQMYTLDQIYNRINDGTAATKMSTFTEPSSGPGSTMHTLDEIYALVGERAQVPKTGQTTSYATGDDGYLQKGVSWPSPRFTDNLNGTVTDNLTGLIWLKNANCAGGTVDWATALSYSNALYDGCTNCFGTSGDCGLSDGSTAGDWRLPNVRELFSLIDFSRYNPALPSGYSTYFSGVQSNFYWTSTTRAASTSYAWLVYLYGGYVYYGDETYDSYVWPVRGGQ